MSGYVLGLDLGQQADYSALAVLERPSDSDAGYAVRHLHRFALGAPYTDVAKSVATLATSGPLRGSPLVTDQTGVGRAVVDLLRQSHTGCWVVPVTITAGHSVTTTPDQSYHVPKKELVSVMQLLLQRRSLKIAQELPHADLLVREMQTFKVKISVTAHESFEAWREGDHDDLVLAVALACWWAYRHPPLTADSIGVGEPSGFANPPRGVFNT